MTELISRMNQAMPLGYQLAFLIRVLVATLCGGAIGLERTKRLKEAGIRTHCLVCCASALIMIVSKYAFADLSVGDAFFFGDRGADPARIAAQVVSGISFIGLAVIYRNGSTLKGLTTAAGIWATAGIGLAIGAGMYPIGIATTIIIILMQTIMHKFNIGNDALATRDINITMNDTPELRDAFLTELKRMAATLPTITMAPSITASPSSSAGKLSSRRFSPLWIATPASGTSPCNKKHLSPVQQRAGDFLFCALSSPAPRTAPQPPPRKG